MTDNEFSERYSAPAKPTRRSHKLFGQKITVDGLAEIAGINRATMHDRLRRGLTPEQAITKPVRIFGEDLTGRVFERLTVVERAGFTKAHKQRWFCRCSCGRPDLADVVGADLKSGVVISCGCFRAERAAKAASARCVDITGQVFADGNIEVIGRSTNWKFGKRGEGKVHRHRLWTCLCRACGTRFDVVGPMLRAGQVTSCGCGATMKKRGETARAARAALAERYPFHGESLTLVEISTRTVIALPTLRYRIVKLGLTAEVATTVPVRQGSSPGKPKLCRLCRKPKHNASTCPQRSDKRGSTP